MAGLNGIYTWMMILMMCLSIESKTTNREIPEYLHICRKSDPDLVGCMKTSIETIRPFLVSGIPELDIPTIEPMRIGDLLVSENTQGNGLRITAKDIDSYGSSNFVIKSLEVVEYGKQYAVEVFFPRLRVEGTYDIGGQLLLLPIRGNGKFVGNFSDCTGNARLQFANKDGAVQIKKFQIKIKVGKGRLQLHNLFNGDKALGNAINDVINQNFDTISRDIIPLVEKALSKTLRRISSKILQNFNYDLVFPV